MSKTSGEAHQLAQTGSSRVKAPPVHKADASNLPWAVVLAGLLALYAPTVLELARTVWTTDEGFHGAIVAAVVVWLLWTKRAHLRSTDAHPQTLLGLSLLVPGLFAYILGRSQDILLLDVGSLIPVLAGAVLILNGGASLRGLWFPLFYILFLIPLPGLLVDSLTGPLKNWVSVLAENILHAFGYPIARSGVMLAIGPYQLLVADACSGLHSIFSLSALGLLYMHLTAHPGKLHNGIMLASLVPVAFASNVVRVLILVLVTFHLGDDAGQGFLHGMAGMVLMVMALLMLFALDGVLSRLLPQPHASREAA